MGRVDRLRDNDLGRWSRAILEQEFAPPAWVFLFYGMPIIAGIAAGAITGGSARKNVLAGALCAIPATVVYWYMIEMAYLGRGEGFIPPAVLVVTAWLGAIGGLISYGIQSPGA